ncbi:MAG: protein tyrosine phosphatase [Schwartzia succinivorans]|nr:protein tyrosine phosphatase [Schwartzia succinivorans]
MRNLLKKTTILLISLLLLTVASVSEAKWRLDEDPELAEPRNFRMASDNWRVEPEDEPPTREGLDNLRISGSAQCTAAGFASLYTKLSAAAAPGAPIYDVDLRQESHGFADGLPVSWHKKNNLANEGKTPEEVALDEEERLADLAGVTTTFVPKGKTDKGRVEAFTFAPQNVQTEKEVVEALGFRYVRFYVTDRTQPDTETIEAFLDFVDSLPGDAWLHFHCRAGHGRTTTFMAMYDMIRNPGIPAETIIERQHLIGGADLTAMKDEEWKNERIIQRLETLKLFSEYVRARHAGETTLRWGEWIEEEAEAA